MTEFSPSKILHQQSRAVFIARLLFSASVALYLLLAWHLLNGPDFNDETEKLIAAQLVVQGHRLYGDVFVQHGPLAYIPAHLFYLAVRIADVAALRCITIVLSLGTILAVIRSSVFEKTHLRYVAGTIFTVGLASILAIYSVIMTMYQVYAGFLFVVLLATLILPLLANNTPSRRHALIGGASAAAIVWCAISFGIAILAFAFALVGFAVFAPKRRAAFAALLWAASGATVVSIAVAAWLFFFGSLSGLYIDHVYINLTYYRHYLAGFNFWNPLLLLIPGESWRLGLDPADPIALGVPSRLGALYTHVLFGTTPFLILMLARIAYLRRSLGNNHMNYVVVLLLVGIGVLWINPRCTVEFGGSTFAIALIGLAALTVPACTASDSSPSIRALVIAGSVTVLATAVYAQLFGMTYLYLVTPLKYYAMKGALGRERSPQLDFLRTLVSDDERVAQVPFNLHFYIRSGRLPALGVFYWMPWMNDYSRSPLPQVPLTFCDDLQKALPAAILYTTEGIWGNPTDGFASCVKDLIHAKYIRVPTAGEGVWIRADKVANNIRAMRAALIDDLTNMDISEEDRQAIERTRLAQSQLEWNSDVCIAANLGDHGPVAAVPCGAGNARLGFDNHRLTDAASGECLEVVGASREPGAQTRFWPCMNGASNQMFETTGDKDHFEIKNVFSGLCLIPANGKIIQASCDTDRKWRRLKLGGKRK